MRRGGSVSELETHAHSFAALKCTPPCAASARTTCFGPVVASRKFG